MSKVLALATFKIFPADMGGQKGVALFYKYLRDHHEIFLAVSDNNPAAENVFPVLFNNRRILNNYSRLAALERIIKENKIDIIISEHSYPAWIASKLSRKFNIPFIIHSHNIEALRFQKMKRWWWKLYWKYERRIHRKADHNFFISREDRNRAIQNFGLSEEKCSIVTYGTELGNCPPLTPLPGRPVFLFNGTLDYAPNEQAVRSLIENVNPLLTKKIPGYRIIISGKGASKELVAAIENAESIEFHGFVSDLSTYYAGCTAFLNTVVNDTGIKTKVVEAIAAGCTVVSTVSGGSGMMQEVCGNKLRTSPDGDWEAFANAIAASVAEPRTATPDAFYAEYSWKNICQKAAGHIQNVIYNKK